MLIREKSDEHARRLWSVAIPDACLHEGGPSNVRADNRIVMGRAAKLPLLIEEFAHDGT